MIRSTEVILFLHIPKTAGNTVGLFFERQLAPYQWFTLNWQGRNAFEEYASLPEEVKHPLRLIKGHMQFGIHNLVNKPSAYVTLLRNPIDRIVSSYYYTLAEPTHYLHERTKGITLEEYATSGLAEELDNVQVRLLAGRLHLPVGAIRAADLQLARENLRSHFAVVGHQEDVPGFLVALTKRFGLRNIVVKPQNVTPRRPLLASIPDTLKSAIEERNEFDMELYREVMKTQPARSSANIPTSPPGITGTLMHAWRTLSRSIRMSWLR